MADKTWGGARPGSGRKPAEQKDKRVQMTVTVDRETRDALRWAYTYRHIRPGKMIDHLVGKCLDDSLMDL